MKGIYLLMAIIGSIVPYYFFFQFFGTEGLNLPLFVKALFPNGAAGGFSADLLITSVVLCSKEIKIISLACPAPLKLRQA